MNYSYRERWIGYKTIVLKEIRRILRIWSQTLLPPVVTSVLYFIIFGRVIGSRVGEMGGYEYIQFIAPGLIMMNVITNSFTSAAFSFYSAKFQRNIEELLVSPMSNIIILLGYMTGGMLRGILIGIVVTIIALFFTHLHVYSWVAIISVTLLSTCIFSLSGVINALLAKSFDDISIIPTFVLAPLTYLGGVFYSITLLPQFWQYISLENPIVYIVSSFRYGFLGISHGHIFVPYFVMILFVTAMFVLAFYLLKKGVGIRE